MTNEARTGEEGNGQRATGNAGDASPASAPVTCCPLPLTGVRVLDLGMYWAGPLCGALLADMGAEVIKVESPRRPDPLRLQPRGLFPGGDPGPDPWNRSGMVNERNRNKLGLSLDLTTADGRAVFLRLASVSDVVIENFSVGVLDRLGLGYPDLCAVNPSIVLASLASQGLTGPERDYVSFGPVLEETSGIAALTGYPGADPQSYTVGLALPDPLGGAMGASAILSVLIERQRTGRGAHIDLSQRQAASLTVGELLLDYAMNGRVPGPLGNRHPVYAPQGAYPCRPSWAGESWVTISVRDDAEWQRLCAVMERPDLAAAPQYAHAHNRYRAQDAIDEAIARWTQTLDAETVTTHLQAEGIAAAPVLNAAEMFIHPQYLARGFWELVPHPSAGDYQYRAEPVRLERVPVASRRPAPLLGEHTVEILRSLLGMDAIAVRDLEASGITGMKPEGAAFG
jgi:crotonobetainyl-CoA:carnitine CoA-transferase CaiB-like acyl-CoA transferase